MSEIIPHGSERKLLADTVMPGASDGELSFFAQVCNRMGLDPFRREIFAIKRRVKEGDQWVERWVYQTGIDGYRKRAASTGLYAGSEESTQPELEPRPVIATATVYRLVGGQRVPFTAKARWDEYAQTGRDGQPVGLWAKMPHTMLAKCAEAKALRKAFPDELAGVLTEEEMGQADNPAPTPKRKPAGVNLIAEITPETVVVSTDPEIEAVEERLNLLMSESDLSSSELDGALSTLYGKPVRWFDLPTKTLAALVQPEKWAKVLSAAGKEVEA